MTTTAMKPKRIDYTDNQHSILYAETRGFCPLCKSPILFRKPGTKKITKSYEIAHIFPLHPTPAQTLALVGRTPPVDINGLENVIALCPTCHTRYDKSFQLDEMDHIRKLKDGFLADTKAKETAAQYLIQQEVFEILDKIVVMGSDVATMSWSSLFGHSDRGCSFKLSELPTPAASRSHWVTGIPAWSAT